MNTQTETKHTPGPWGVQRYRTHTGFSILAGDRGCIAERWYDNQQQQPYGDEILANARLIAAAPELLETLQVIVSNTGLSYHGIKDLARAAIAKATEGAQ